MSVQSMNNVQQNKVARIGIVDLLGVCWLIAAILVFLKPRFEPKSFESAKHLVCVVCFMLVAFVLPFVLSIRTRSTWGIAFFLIWFCVSLTQTWYSVGLATLSLLAVIVFRFFAKRACSTWTKSLWASGLVLVLSMPIGYFLELIFPYPRLQVVINGRRAYPIVDLSDRLRPNARNPISLAARVSSVDMSLFGALEDVYDMPQSSRTYALKQFHNESYERFVRRFGFGVARMIPLSVESARLPEIEDIAFEAPLDLNLDERRLSDSKFKSLQLDRIYGQTIGNVPESVFRISYLDFLHPYTFGWLPGTMKAAGFRPHAFVTGLPKLKTGRETYQLKRLELISLMNFSVPRVYVLDHLPRMDQLTADDIETRGLNTFEDASLQRIQAGESLVIESMPDRLVMVGALRAIDQCTECHQGPRGTVLGAFSYEFGLAANR